MKFLGFILLASLSNSLAQSPFHNPNCQGNRVAMVHLFEWKWTDIAAECERFLGPMGFCGVQLSPPNEHIVIKSNPPYPWWQRYQPVSYKLVSRSGNEAEFTDMVRRCNKVGVRIYPDIVINHMAGAGRSGTGTAGSSFNADKLDFPGVPYSSGNFHSCTPCPGGCNINSWTDTTQVRICRLLGLVDLDQSQPDTKQKTVNFLNHMIDIGVAGFRVDAAKHMWPKDLKAIYEQTKPLNTEYFPQNSRAYFFQEVIDMNQQGEVRAQEYVGFGKVTEMRYCSKIRDMSENLRHPGWLYDAGWGMVKPENAFVFVDNHDNQRGHGAGGQVVTFKDGKKYKVAQAVTLSQTYGSPRLMSSYNFKGDGDGPPHNPDWSTKTVKINPDGSCADGWVCEHRWPVIAGMTSFAKAVKGTQIQNFWQNGNKVAFSRDNKGFVAISNEGNMDQTLKSGLPSGQYCNVIQGCPTKSGCTGDVVTVNGDGSVQVKITDGNNPVFAIHVEARAGSGSCIAEGVPPPTGGPTRAPPATPGPPVTHPPVTPSPSGRTIIFLLYRSTPGQEVFIRGGIDHTHRHGCTHDADTSKCAISIIHNELGKGSHYQKFNTWKSGDTKLDWYGAQRGQGRWQGHQAAGTPLVWTSNQQGNSGYQPLNKYGNHYWMVDVSMECSEGVQGWFEFKAYVSGHHSGWEHNINQAVSCSGTAGGFKPFGSGNHFARCGFINVFHFNGNSCEINKF